MYRLELLGEGVRLSRGDELLHFDTRSALLLAFLALAGPASRERLAGLLWPDGDEARARGNLRQLLLRLRRVAPVVHDAPLRLAPEVVVDVLEALADPAGGSGPTELLAGFDAGFSSPLEEWLDVERARFAHTMRARLLERVAEQRAAGRIDHAIAAARRSLAFDAVSETASRMLMELQLEQGDVGGAIETFGRCRETMARVFDASPSPRTIALGERAAALLAEQVRASPLPVPEGTAPVDPAALARRAETGGWLREGAALLRLAAATTPPSIELGSVLVNLAWLEHQLGHGADAARTAEEGVTLLRRHGDRARLVDGLFVLGSLARHRGDVDAARRFWREALQKLHTDFETRGSDAGLVVLHLNLGLVEDALNDSVAASGHYLEVIRASRPGRDDAALATALNNLGHARLVAGRPEEARALLGRSMTLARAVDDRQLEGHVLDGLARIEAEIGDAHKARSLASRAVELARDLGDHALQIEALTTLAGCWRALGDSATAASVARMTLRNAWEREYLPGVGRAVLELAATAPADDPQSRALLTALAHDERLPSTHRERARLALGDAGEAEEVLTLDDLIPVTLG